MCRRGALFTSAYRELTHHRDSAQIAIVPAHHYDVTSFTTGSCGDLMTAARGKGSDTCGGRGANGAVIKLAGLMACVR